MRFYDWNGEQLTIDEISARTGIKSSTIRGRLRRGTDILEAATIPTDKKRRAIFRGEMLTIAEISERTGIPKNTLYDNIKRDPNADEAVEAILRRSEEKIRTAAAICGGDRMAIAEKIRREFFGSLGRMPPIREHGKTGGLAFGEGLYRYELSFLGRNRVAVTAIYNPLGHISSRWEYGIEGGKLRLEERARIENRA